MEKTLFVVFYSSLMFNTGSVGLVLSFRSVRIGELLFRFRRK